MVMLIATAAVTSAKAARAAAPNYCPLCRSDDNHAEYKGDVRTVPKAKLLTARHTLDLLTFDKICPSLGPATTAHKSGSVSLSSVIFSDVGSGSRRGDFAGAVSKS